MRTTSRLRALTGMASAIGLIMVAGCGPTQEELMAESDAMLTAVQDAADLGVMLARDLNPDVDLELSYDPALDDWWSDCSNMAAPDSDSPTHIVWLADRHMLVAPAQNTGPMIDPIVAGFVEDGWVAGTEASGDGGRAVYVSKDGYSVAVRGVTDVPESGRAATLIISVSSPCIQAPDGIADRES